jgi:addiction module RelE/StbE family toxin
MELKRPRWTTPALSDLVGIGDYVARDNRDAAARVVTSIRAHAARLSDYPELGRPGRIEGTRELVVPRLPYVVVYRLVVGEAEILTVLHTSQKYP